MGKLSVVATPIGNMEDITLRALRTFREASVIFCEDTRVTMKLLSHNDIHTKVVRADTHRERSSAELVLKHLEAGEHVAYVSDAGTPGISDPGALLVRTVRARMPEAVIEAIPGASALSAALSIAGMEAETFSFIGFLPHKKGRETAFKNMAEADGAIIFYESPHRILKALQSLITFCPRKSVTVLRELTKMFEEVQTGSPEQVFAYYTAHGDKVRGEFVVIVE